MHRLADTVRRGVHSPSSHTPWASLHIKRPTRGGAFSLATFKYYSTVSQYDLNLSDLDRLMSQLKYAVLSPLCPGLKLTASSRPDFGPEGLPTLPTIESADIEMRVFTHRSFAARPTHVFEDSPEDPSPDNEQSVVPAVLFGVSKRL